MDAPPSAEATRIERALKMRPVGWREITRRGQTNASHWLVELPNGSQAFVKCARGDDTASWIRDEHIFYAQTRDAPFRPGCSDGTMMASRPVIALEDLSAAIWPPPWTREHVDAVAAHAWREMAVTPPPPDLPRAADSQFDFQGWDGDRGRSGGVPPRWDSARRHGSMPPCPSCDSPRRSRHSTVTRSCTSTCGATTSASAMAAPCSSIGTSPVSGTRWRTWRAWLPSLHAEGGPAPDEILPEGAAELAALFAGYFASHAGPARDP